MMSRQHSQGKPPQIPLLLIVDPTKSEWAMLFMNSVGTHEGNEHTRNSSGNARPQSSQLAEPLFTGSGLKERNWWKDLRPLKEKGRPGNDSTNLPLEYLRVPKKKKSHKHTREDMDW